ncbi:MFS transporter (plasmid) [Rhodococcus oxybenzonivorans]|uniref:MFS transporter n=2 Tax=Rhodococcus oxybenzonivorans TaxID=1990687 RepID=A0A2S2C690_9NOCA|nr:MFS transporter [Rhodococcus oxybenzonivorans]
MGKYQMSIVGICFAIILAEGYDLLLMAFAATVVAEEWGLSGSQLGVLLSSSLIGIGLGSLFVAPLADRTGRRPLSLGCLLFVGLSMVFASVSTSYVQLGISRLLTGIGIGGLVACLPVIIAEFSPRRRRTSMILLYTTGLPIGGIAAGAVAVSLNSSYGWRASFVVGAIVTLLLCVVVNLRMPESLDYLVYRRPPGALEQINATLPKMGLAPIAALPEPEPHSQGMKATMFEGRNGVRSLLLCSAFFFAMAAFHFAASWTPRLLQQSGMSTQQGISGGMLFNLGGIAATVTFSVLAVIATHKLLIIVSAIGAALSFLAVGVGLGTLTFALIAVVAVGFCMQATNSGLLALAPDCYPAQVRTTALGWALAVGRIGSILSPILVGILVDREWSPSSIFVLFAIPLLVTALLVAAIKIPVQPPMRTATKTAPA